MAYRGRSPVNHVNELETPLLIHTNTIDEDVNVLEVEHLIDSLKAAGKKFEKSRVEVYHFFNGYLHPANPIN